MARRISGVGCVTVSLRRSIIFGLSFLAGLAQGRPDIGICDLRFLIFDSRAKSVESRHFIRNQWLQNYKWGSRGAGRRSVGLGRFGEDEAGEDFVGEQASAVGEANESGVERE